MKEDKPVTPKKGKRKYVWTKEQIAKRVETARLRREEKKAAENGYDPDVRGALYILRAEKKQLVLRIRNGQDDITETETAIINALRALQGHP